jgi:hypothetical protein
VFATIRAKHQEHCSESRCGFYALQAVAETLLCHRDSIQHEDDDHCSSMMTLLAEVAIAGFCAG